MLCSALLCFAAFTQGHRTILGSEAIPVALVSRQQGSDKGTVHFTTLDNKVRKVRLVA